MILVALMLTEEIITLKETTQMKRFLMMTSEKTIQNLITNFKRSKSLFSFRSDLRGQMGMPRIRSTDNDGLNSKFALNLRLNTSQQ